jgi:DNA helicase HerA-like ATPase
MLSRSVNDLRVYDFDQFDNRLRWSQDQHFTIVAPTGGGKTTVARRLLTRRKRFVFLATKPHDPSIDSLRKDLGATIVRGWPPRHVTERVIVWPKAKGLLRDVGTQRITFAHAIDNTYLEGANCIVLDEAEYVTQALGLDRMLRVLWAQGRSNKVGVLAMTQRPRFLPRIAWSSANHLLLGRTREREDIAALGGMGGLDAGLIRSAVASIPRHWWVYVNTRTEEIAVVRPMEVKT